MKRAYVEDAPCVSANATSDRTSLSQSGDLTQAPKAKWSKETYIALLAGCGILAHLIARYILRAASGTYNFPLILVLLVGGAPLLFDLLKRVMRREFGSGLLAGLSIAVSIVLGQYLAGSIVVLMLSGGNALENYASRRASGVLDAVAKRMPRNVHRRTPRVWLR